MTWTDPRTGVTIAHPRGPEWGYPGRIGGMPNGAPPPPPSKPRGPLFAVVALVLLGATSGFAITSRLLHDDPSAPSATPPTPTTNPAPNGGPNVAPTDPDASALDGLVVRASDVSAVDLVVTIPGGQAVTGETTLDLCNGTFPSETERTARRQVEVVDPITLTAPFSTEAVLYGHAAGATQAFSELRRVASQCPDSAVVSPVGEPTVTTRFSAPPDGSWDTTNSVRRQAYAFTTTDELGNSEPGISVYLRRGRVLMGLYFRQPNGEQIAVNGNSSIPTIVGEFEHRIAALPASVVNGP